MILQTDRLQLIPYNPTLLAALLESADRFEEASGLRVAEGFRDFVTSGEVSPEWLAKALAPGDHDPWLHGFAIVDPAERLAIGGAAFKGPPDAVGVVEIGYGVVPSYQGRGLATEAARALVGFALDEGRAKVVRAHTLRERNASVSVLTRCGFTFVGEVEDPEDGPVWRWERHA